MNEANYWHYCFSWEALCACTKESADIYAVMPRSKLVLLVIEMYIRPVSLCLQVAITSRRSTFICSNFSEAYERWWGCSMSIRHTFICWMIATLYTLISAESEEDEYLPWHFTNLLSNFRITCSSKWTVQKQDCRITRITKMCAKIERAIINCLHTFVIDPFQARPPLFRFCCIGKHCRPVHIRLAVFRLILLAWSF